MIQAIHTLISGTTLLIVVVAIVITMLQTRELQQEARFRLRFAIGVASIIILVLLGWGRAAAESDAVVALILNQSLATLALAALALAVIWLGVLAQKTQNALEEKVENAQQRLGQHQESYQRLIRERTATLQQEILRGQKLREALERHSTAMEQDLRFTAQAQAALSTEPPNVDFCEIAQYSAAEELVNGDFVHTLVGRDQRVLVALGDAMGHGAAAGFMTVMVRTAINNLDSELPPFIMLDQINRTLAERDTGIYVTAAVAQIHPNGQCFVGQAGHPPSLHYRARHGDVVALQQGGFALGMFADTGTGYDQTALQLEPDDLLIMYSDGVTEASNEDNEYFGQAGLSQAVLDLIDAPPTQMVEGIIDKVYDHCGANALRDDLSLVITKYRGSGTRGLQKPS